MKKTLLVLGALSAFALLFTGCPKSSDSPQKTVTNSDDTPDVPVGEETGTVKTEALTLDELSSGYGSSYDATTKTITFDDAWKGRGWWLGEKDAGTFTKFIFTFEENSAGKLQIVIEYNDDGVANTTAATTGASESGSIEAKLAGKSLKQIYLQSEAAGTVKVVSGVLSE